MVGCQAAPERAEVGVGVDGETRSRRRKASSEPSSAVMVVFPGPPFGETTAIVAHAEGAGR